MAFYRLEPWGVEPDDLRAGIVASVVANANRDPKRQKKPFQPGDFMPAWDRQGEPTREQSPEEQLRILQTLQAAFSTKFQK